MVSLWTSRPTKSILLDSPMADLHARLCLRARAALASMRLIRVERRRSASPRGSHTGGAAIAAVGAVVGLLVVIGIVAKLFDLKQKRESEAVQLQAQLSDALLREPSLAGLPLTPTVHGSMWKGTPATIEMMGRAPTPEGKDAGRRIVRA